MRPDRDGTGPCFRNRSRASPVCAGFGTSFDHVHRVESQQALPDFRLQLAAARIDGEVETAGPTIGSRGEAGAHIVQIDDGHEGIVFRLDVGDLVDELRAGLLSAYIITHQGRRAMRSADSDHHGDHAATRLHGPRHRPPTLERGQATTGSGRSAQSVPPGMCPPGTPASPMAEWVAYNPSCLCNSDSQPS